jgi:hypothetical protein
VHPIHDEHFILISTQFCSHEPSAKTSTPQSLTQCYTFLIRALASAHVLVHTTVYATMEMALFESDTTTHTRIGTTIFLILPEVIHYLVELAFYDTSLDISDSGKRMFLHVTSTHVDTHHDKHLAQTFYTLCPLSQCYSDDEIVGKQVHLLSSVIVDNNSRPCDTIVILLRTLLHSSAYFRKGGHNTLVRHVLMTP